MPSMALAALLAAAAAGDAASSASMNALYEAIAAGAMERRLDLSRQAYAPQATFLDERTAAIEKGEALHERMRASMQRLRDAGGRASIRYRVARRAVLGDHFVDSGYYRVTTRLGDQTEQVAYRKFLLVAKQAPDGRWLITDDASLPSSKEAFEAAQPFEDAKYDRD